MAKKLNSSLKKTHKHKLKLRKKDLILRAKFYRIFHPLTKAQRCSIIPYLSDTAINYLCEAVFNTVKTDIGLNDVQKNVLRKELQCCKSKIHHLCTGKGSVDTKRKILAQKGGFLGALLGTVLPIITSLIANK